MKKMLVLACLALVPTVSMAAELYVCTGLVGTDTVTLVDTGRQVWVVKGTFDVTEGPGSLPKHLFRQQVVQPTRITEDQCTLVVEGQNSMTLKSDCGVTESNAAATLSVNIAAIGLTATDAPVTCNIVDVGDEGGAPEETQPAAPPAQDETAH